MAERIASKGAEMINLVISDVIDPPHLKSDLHNPVSYFGTPVAPDQTTITDHLTGGGPDREVGTFLAGVVKKITARQRPVPPPCVLIVSGETTTRINRVAGRKGPSQELALRFALELAYLPGSSLIALDTEGTDGPTACAGGIVDAQTVKRAKAISLNIYSELNEDEFLESL